MPTKSVKSVSIALGVAGALGLSAMAMPQLSADARAQTPARTFNIAQSGGFADLVEMVKPSVVSVRVVNRSRQRYHRRGRGRGEGYGRREREGYGRMRPDFRGMPEGRGFREFIEPFMHRYGGRPRPRRRLAQGSGFFISTDGYIVTNQHVINNHSRVTITMHDGKKYPAKVVGSDKRTDLALLKVDAERKFQPVSFAKTPARVGDWVIAVGNPFGLGGSVTTGIISARGREIGSNSYGDYLQIDAAINRGNSGGPAFNLKGEVIGVNTAIFSPTGGSVGIGFAIPARIAADVIEQLKTTGKITRGWLGVSIQRVSGDLAESLGLKSAYGAMVVQVMKDSPAEKAGLRVRDTILSLNGIKVTGPGDLARKVSRLRPGAQADIELLRDGKRMVQKVAIEALPGKDRLAAARPRPETNRRALARLGLELRRDRDGGAVIITDIDPDSAAAEKGLRPGDRIIEVDGNKVQSPRDVRDIVQRVAKQGKRAVMMLVRTRRGERFIAIRLKRA
jgi:serine protease Do